MQIQVNGKQFLIDEMSAFLNIIGFIALTASIWDGLGPIVVALLIFIFDSLRYPYPVIMEIVEEGDDNDGDNMVS